MNITVDIMKKINGSVASGDLLPLSEIARECCLDETVLESVAGSLERPVYSMKFFFKTMESYLSELHKRVRMLSECYTAIQRVQIENSMIAVGEDQDDPPIVW